MGDGIERLCGPRGEPIDGAAIHECGELSTSIAETVSNWTESEDDVKVFTNELNEVSIHVLTRVDFSSLFAQWTNLMIDMTKNRLYLK